MQIDDPHFWTHMEGFTPERAAALAARIDPKRLDQLKDLQITDQPDEEQIEFHYGAKHDEYIKARELIDIAVTAGALPLVGGLILADDLYPWLEQRGLFDPRQLGPQTSHVIDVFLESFLGTAYQDYARLKLAILGAKRYATGEAKTQPEVVEYLGEEMGVGAGEFVVARKKIAYVSQPDSRGVPGRR